MAKITYVSATNETTVLDIPAGNSVMRGAVVHGVEGILGQCGGGAMCGTCHVYIDEASQVTLPVMRDVEDELLFGTASPRCANSRLSCQLQVTDVFDGLVVHMPPTQV